ncbi:hypothetical protein IVB16_31425 [Bradyrhizobium sp. 183]|uniref:hypothetical protein n=1 Tax=unclassified Bradyrhizobium TaxID=2631580 RepID=UPI00200005C7|nr:MULTISPECIES: hypothetical protein [unclassified Bradyrhizobium]UPJ79257.1 hypothetical protein IVB17_31425 [Bradyrhizobium sp. 184]UPJ87050.1 hypothetical protein IVB16_31425 [Bradyrhizobium sp. 183]
MIRTLKPEGPRLGIVSTDFIDCRNTIDLPDPFNGPPPRPDEPTGFFMHPDFWPVPTAFAIAPGSTGSALIEGKPAAVEAIAKAVDRLAPHCDLIVGNCGYMYYARSAVRSKTPTLLSALQLIPYALESTIRPVGILTFNKDLTQKMLAGHQDFSRLRIVGVSDLPNWSAISHRDFLARFDVEACRREIIEVCLQERETGAFTDIGSIVLECTAMPQYRADIVAAVELPTWDIAAFAKTLLGA